jgi:hypothetical protein
MESIFGEIDKLGYPFPVIILLRTLDSVGSSSLVLNGQDASTRGVNQPERALGRVVLSSFGNGLGRRDMIAVGKV